MRNARFRFGYDAVDRLTSEQATGSTIHLNTSLVYDADGRRTGFYDRGVFTGYTYDAADQLLRTQGASSATPTVINSSSAD